MTAARRLERLARHVRPAAELSAAAPDRLRVGRSEFDFPSRELDYMRPSNELLERARRGGAEGEAAATALRERLAEDGYLLLKKIIPQRLVEAARQRAVRAVRESLDSHGLHPVVAHVMLVSHSWHDDPAIAGMTESPELFDVFETLFGEPAVTYDNKWMRGMAPGGHSAFHMDHIYMGLGSRQLITTWIPLHDVSWDTGGLAVLEGSSSLEGFRRMRDTYGEWDTNLGEHSRHDADELRE